MATSSALGLRKRQPRPVESELPARYRARVLGALPGRVERILLFGSRARGEARPESDWDFAVFLDHEPTPHDKERISAIGQVVGRAFGAEVQSHLFPEAKWLATSELLCNVRDQGLIIYGPDHVPMIERPVLAHARDALDKAERFAELAAGTLDDRYEGVVHGAYDAMFHAARAALLAVEGSASTNHGRVVETFAAMVKQRQLGEVASDLAKTLSQAHELRAEADYGNDDLTEVGRQLRERVRPFLIFCHNCVDQHPDKK